MTVATLFALVALPDGPLRNSGEPNHGLLRPARSILPGAQPRARGLQEQHKRELRASLLTEPGRTGVAAVLANGQVVYEHAANELFPLQSVAKLYMLLAFLDKLEAEDREPTTSERDDLTWMISASDNDSAWEIGRQLGGIAALEAFLAGHGLKPIVAPEDGSWGSIRDTPANVARLLARLHGGRLLGNEMTALAKELLGSVIESQLWGVTAGIAGQGTHVFLKNGWYPEESGWCVNSAGIIDPPTRPDYSLVVLSCEQPTFEDGLRITESASLVINRALGEGP
jgi:hypothetical protein